MLIWFHAIWWMVAQKNGVSAKGLQKVPGLGSYQTAWTWLHKFRRLLEQAVITEPVTYDKIIKENHGY
ncbi:MAG: hypothetical protein ACK5HT_18660 [Draconibacterium sp.]